MEEQLKEKWVEALESGNYKQTTGQLKMDDIARKKSGYSRRERPDGHCCLGVLCEVAGLPIAEDGQHIKGAGIEKGYEPLYPLIGEEILPELYGMNDSGKYSFVAIAKYIRENL